LPLQIDVRVLNRGLLISVPEVLHAPVDYRTPHEFTESESKLLEVFANQAALAIHNADLLERAVTSMEIMLNPQDITSAPSPSLLSPDYLATVVAPYLKAVADLQDILDELQGRKPSPTVIRAIRGSSPISVNLEGASDAVQQIEDMVVPWRREHAKAIARLTEQEKHAEIEIKKAEILERRARARRDREEAERLAAEAAKQREEAERLRLGNERLRLELHRSKIQLAVDILAQVAPNLSETDRIAYVVRLLPPLDVLMFSELELSTP
jgi:hypothetical protein